MRARNIKPGFYKNESLAECSLAARLLFPGLWMMADREGRLEYRPKRIKAEVFPFDNFDVAPLLDELISFELVKKYEMDGVSFLWIPRFKAHQTPHVKEKSSAIPAHEDEKPAMCTMQAPGKSDASTNTTQGQHPLNPESLLLIPSSSLPENQDTPNGVLSAAPAANHGGHPSGEKIKLGPKPPACPHTKIRDMYHETLPMLPRTVTWDDSRQKHLKARWCETWDRLRQTDKSHDEMALLEWWQGFFNRVRASPFLTGRESGRNGTPFFASLDWLVRPKNYADVLDQKYRDRSQARPT